MAAWLRLFLLKQLAVGLSLLVIMQATLIAEEQKSTPLKIESEQLIQPEVERREVKLDKIDTEDFEASAFFGILSVEDFGANPVYGTRFAYHVNEDIFFEGTVAQSTTSQTSYERISGQPLPLLAGNNSNLLYYNVSLGYNLLPGEGFLTRKKAFNTALYVITGLGTTTFAGADRLTLNVGGGFRFLATDWMAVHIDVRDHIFNIDILAEDKTAHNLEVTLGLSIFF